MIRRLLLLPVCFVLFLSCKKNTGKPDKPDKNSAAYFFFNTDWTGVANTAGQEYPQPVYMHFSDDSTVTVHCLFNWYVNGAYLEPDSIVGKITGIDTVTYAAYGIVTVHVNYPNSNDQHDYHFSNRTKMDGGSLNSAAPVNQQFTVGVQLCPDKIPAMKGSSWTTDPLNPSSPNGSFRYPDLHGIEFRDDGRTYYVRNGLGVNLGAPGNSMPLSYGFAQNGWEVHFAGYNEEKQLLIGYYGILSADGTTLYCDARNHLDTRLPNYVYTSEPYGPNGVTPVMHKGN